jgi:uncharacterized protein YbjT (DUF2867 family)
MAPYVVIIGASGLVGRPLVQEFLKNKTRFGRIAVLSDPAKIDRFADVRKAGIEVVVGSFLEARSYTGECFPFLFPSALLTVCECRF